MYSCAQYSVEMLTGKCVESIQPLHAMRFNTSIVIRHEKCTRLQGVSGPDVMSAAQHRRSVTASSQQTHNLYTFDTVKLSRKNHRLVSRQIRRSLIRSECRSLSRSAEGHGNIVSCGSFLQHSKSPTWSPWQTFLRQEVILYPQHRWPIP